jgi:murein DD-endopeptidase MepM/ murein hydrolase activator NlpD
MELSYNAPGAGRVIAAENGIPDNWYEGKRVVHPDLSANVDPKDLGNYVLIDHGDGEYSILNHMMPWSVVVKSGDLVCQGQMIPR